MGSYPITDDLLYALNAFGVSQDEISSVTPLDKLGINSKNLLVTRNEGRASVVIKSQVDTPESRIKIGLFHAANLQNLSTPSYTLNTQNNPFLSLNETLWTCQPYYTSPPYSGTEREWHLAASSLATLDKWLKTQPSTTSLVRTSLYVPIQETARYDTFLESQDSLSQFKDLIPACLTFIEQIKSTLKAEPTLQHLDLHPDNLLFTENNEACILDSDSLCIVPQFSSASFAAHRFAINQSNMDPVVVMARFLAEYSNIEAIPVDAYQSVIQLCAYEALCRIAYIINSYEKDQSSTWLFEIPKHFSIIKFINQNETRILSEWLRQ
ncbi:phosphotransferase [bacterium]|jgi:hypothetical protein|nr:phosphotransferase [bacterium]